MGDMYRFEDVFLCDPVTKRGINSLRRVESIDEKNRLSFNDFYEKVYVEPYFMSSDYIHQQRNYYDDSMFSNENIKIENMKVKKQDFENKFLSNETDSLLFIRAAAGSGKSIYLNYLKRERRKKYYPEIAGDNSLNNYNEEINELSLDLETSPAYLTYGAITFPTSKYKINSNNPNNVSSPWHFFNMILDSIFNIFKSVIGTLDENKKVTMKNNFDIIYGCDYSDEIHNLYGLVFSNNQIKNDKRKLHTELFNLVIGACLIDPDDVSRSITNSLMVLTRVIAIKSNLNNPKQLLISFDNIEHFIDDNQRIYDEDIKLITNSIVNFATTESIHFDKKKFNFTNFFKIILVIRDTTSKMVSSDVHERFIRADCSVDLTGWYRLEEIYNRKLSFFGIKDECSIAHGFFKLIVSDGMSKNSNSVLDKISTMYNHNFRRTTRILSRIVNTFENGLIVELNNRGILNFQQFCLLWSDEVRLNLKYLCRNAVMRFVFNEISSTGYFGKIYNNISIGFSDKNTYAIRILTWLSNKGSHKDETYYSYAELIKEVLCAPGLHKCEAKNLNIDDFADVLIALDEHRFDDTRDSESKNESTPNYWCQLVILKNNDPELNGRLDAKTLAAKIIEQYNAENNNVDNYGIKLTEAGNSFANFLFEYEFFSCQYDGNNLPLIFILDLKEIKNTINSVFANAKKYIDNILIFESSFFNKKYELAYDRWYNLVNVSKNGKKQMKSIPFRIICSHKFYLEQYKKYMEDETIHEKLKVFTSEQRQDIIKYVDKYIKEYKLILSALDKGFYRVNDHNVINNYIIYKDI